mgnify:CR=1 FL=1
MTVRNLVFDISTIRRLKDKKCFSTDTVVGDGRRRLASSHSQLASKQLTVTLSQSLAHSHSLTVHTQSVRSQPTVTQ